MKLVMCSDSDSDSVNYFAFPLPPLLIPLPTRIEQLTIDVPLVSKVELVPLTEIPVDPSMCPTGTHAHTCIAMYVLHGVQFVFVLYGSNEGMQIWHF